MAATFPGAPCLGMTKLFYDFDPASQARAKGICALCPHKDPCLDYALEHDYTDPSTGVWGGTSPRERRRLKRQRRLARNPNASGSLCPTCQEETVSIPTSRGQRECLECGTRWPPL